MFSARCRPTTCFSAARPSPASCARAKRSRISARTYGGPVGIISKKHKCANLLTVTTTSSMGRSSVYNRLTLGEQKYFRPIGYTVGWGHFHITDRLFAAIRRYLRLKRDPYANNHKFGQGPTGASRPPITALRKVHFAERELWKIRTCPRGSPIRSILYLYETLHKYNEAERRGKFSKCQS